MTSPSRQTYTFAAKDDLSATLAKMAKVADAAEHAFDDLGDEAKQAAASMTLAEKASAKVSRELAEQKRKVLELSAAYALLGDNAEKGAAKELRAARSRQSELEKALKLLTPSLPPPPRGGGGAGAGLFGQALGSPVLPAAIGAAILASPIIGASFNAALLAGVGAGALGVGIASAIRQDQAVKNEFAKLGREFVSVFDDVGAPFVQPLRGAAQFFRAELRGVSDEWVKGIGGMAGVVEPLARGLAGLFTKATPGFLDALKAAEPVIEVLAQELPGLGEDLSTMLESLASGGEGAAEGMRLLVNTTGDLLVLSGEVIEFLSKVHDGLTDIAAGDAILAANLFGWWAPFLADTNTGTKFIKSAGDGFDEVGDAAADAAKDVEGLNRAMTELLGQFMTLDQLEIRIAEGFDAITESVRENGRTLDVNTEKGRNNQRVLLDQVDALVDQRQANIDAGMSVSRANELYNKQFAALLKMATAAGISKKALLELLGPYNQFQSKTVTLTVRQVFTSQGSAYRPSGGGPAFMQHGGPVERGVPVVVGERQAELFVPDSNGRILPSVPTGYGAAGSPLAVEVTLNMKYPDGTVIVEKVQAHAARSGNKTLSGTFGMPA